MEKHTLKQMILNKINNENRGYVQELASISDYSSGSALAKILSDEKKEFKKFSGLIKLVRYLWGNESLKVMVNYSKEVDPNKMTARNLLECLVTCREFEAFNNLLDRMDACKNEESKEWARIYRLQYNYELANVPADFINVMNSLNQINVTITELKIYKRMLKSYCYEQLGDFNIVKIMSDDLKLEIDLIENDYIKDSYVIRLNEIMSYNYLRVHNNPEAARECANKILDSNARKAFKAYAYYIIGYSYFFSSYDQAKNNLNKSIELYESLDRKNDVKDLNHKIKFLSIYWDKNEYEDYYNIVNWLLFNLKKGKDISKQLTENKEKIDDEMYLYLEGLCLKSEKKLMLSLIKFTKKSDFFLANLPKIELLKMGYDAEIIEELTMA